MLYRLLPLALVTAVSCAPAELDEAPPPPPQVPGEYGPANHWFHAMEEDVPSTSPDAAFQSGRQVPNLELMDQNGDMVALHQFAGKMILLEVIADRGREVEEIIEEECDG